MEIVLLGLFLERHEVLLKLVYLIFSLFSFFGFLRGLLKSLCLGLLLLSKFYLSG
jgi:hypothetical protein